MKKQTEDFGDWTEDKEDLAENASSDIDDFAEFSSEPPQTIVKPVGRAHDDDRGFGEFSDKEDADQNPSAT